jgi:AcrR family transcriptional regulator
MSNERLGLRDRKRVATRARMEQAAVELVLRDGFQHATIEAICDAADVSTRTFFNYFDSKEDAVLGLAELQISDSGVMAKTMRGEEVDVVEALVELIVEMTTPALENRALHKPRTEILQRNPELFTKQIARLTRITDELMAAVHTLIAHDPRFTTLATAASPMAELILAMCSAAVRTSAKEWIAAGSDAPIDQIRIRAIALAREVVEKLQ